MAWDAAGGPECCLHTPKARRGRNSRLFAGDAVQNKSSRVFLMLAVVLGVLAMVTTFAFLQSASATDRGPKATIYVAARNLRPNVPLDPDKDLREEQIPANLAGLRQRVLVPENKGAYKGERLNRPVPAGSPVWQADLIRNPGEIQLSGPEMRAMSIQARGAQALSGLLVPGDWVKLFVTRPVMRTYTPPAGGNDDMPPVPMLESSGKFETLLVLNQPVRVLAVGSRLTPWRQQVSAAEQYESAGGIDPAQTVTLEVTEAQAKSILELTGAGQLPVTLVLCPPQPLRGGEPTSLPAR